MQTKQDNLRARIQAFNEANGVGVVIQQAAQGYALFREDTGRPIARLRPTGNGDEVEVMWWSHRDWWDQIGYLADYMVSNDPAHLPRRHRELQV
jgi:hypothetical protein